ncbi:MAG: XcyI family restriction endonuclease [Candidatus Adiutrix sp.]|jgi:hypothetical protein|nr:XcyI family restriction endonuclease [Candidatus Adiutrix sp.]
MSRADLKIIFPPPQLQTDFAFTLKHLRSTYLQDALLATISGMKIAEVDKQLARYVSDKDLAIMAKYSLRGELLFSVPIILEKNPYLLGYYRLLMGYSQKEFYGKDGEFGVSAFKHMEIKGIINKTIAGNISALCRAFCGAASSLLHGIEALKPNKELLDNLAILTVGPQLRGGRNNKIGAAGIDRVFEIIKSIVVSAASKITRNTIEITNAAKRKVLIEFSADPDITISEEIGPDKFRNVVAIEIKSGQDISNIHNRIGEAEKSHQKAKARKYTEFWTVVNVERLDLKTAKEESPTTDRFYLLNTLIEGNGIEFDDFRQRIIALTGLLKKKKASR